MKIVLIGYMASGKSTVGKELSKKIYIPFIDLDNFIEEGEGKSVSKIFEENGEIYFRKKEHEYLKQLLDSEDNFVLSLGGGTPCYAGNMDMVLNSDTTSIYLKASLKTLYNRLQKQKATRPLVASISDEKLSEFIAKHLFERRFYYEKANFNLKIDDKKVSDIITELRILLH